MEEILIAGHRTGSLSTILQRHPNVYDAIIITDYEAKFPDWVAPLVKSYIHLRFDDIVYPLGNRVVPNQPEIEKAIAFAEGKEKLVVACHMGISRSSATALLIASKEWGVDKALTLLDPLRHSPNALVLKIGSEMLKNHEIVVKYNEWVSRNFRCDDEADFGLNSSDVEYIDL